MAIGTTIGALNVVVGMNTGPLNKGILKARGMLTVFSKSAAVGAVALSALAVGAGIATISVVKLSRSFEGLNQAMTRSLAIMTGVSSEMRDKMTQAAIDISKVTQFSAAQAAEAYFFLGSAGLDAAQAMAALPQVAYSRRQETST